MNIDDKDLALEPVKLLTAPEEKFDQAYRRFQGIPAIERSRGGRLYTSFYSGGKGEGQDNYVVLLASDDDGFTWSLPKLIIDPPGKVRAFDSCLWLDPQRRLWLFWAQSFGLYDGRCGVWASVCEDPDGPDPAWSSPRRICDGIMMNKPTVLSTGEWLFPACLWEGKYSTLNDLPDEQYSNVYVSLDQGISFFKRGFADVPNRHCDEHMIVERRDGSLWMLVRTTYGIGESVSLDRGATWSPGKPTRLGGPNSRFFIRRLQSGRLLLVNHYGFRGRSHLTAQLSDDDGYHWSEGLLLDERENVAYPDGTQAPDGTLYIIYDRERKKDMEILLAVIREEDIDAGRCVSLKAWLKQQVVKAGITENTKAIQDPLRLLKYRNVLHFGETGEYPAHLEDETGQTVYAAVRYIEEHMLQIRDMKEISNAVGYSLSHLSRLFSQELGVSMQSYFTKRKCQKAMDLLEEGSWSITKIASILHYESIHTFSRAFRKTTGVSPSEYIRRFQETCEAADLVEQCETTALKPLSTKK